MPTPSRRTPRRRCGSCPAAMPVKVRPAGGVTATGVSSGTRGAVTEVAVEVVPPGVDLAGRRQRQAVVTPGRHLRDDGAGRQGHRRRHVLGLGGPVAELAVGAGSPGVDGAGRRQRQRVAAAGHDLGHDGADRQVDGGRRGCRSGGPVAQLAQEATTPCVDRPGPGEPHTEGPTGRDGGHGGAAVHRNLCRNGHAGGAGPADGADADLAGVVAPPAVEGTRRER